LSRTGLLERIEQQLQQITFIFEKAPYHSQRSDRSINSRITIMEIAIIILSILSIIGTLLPESRSKHWIVRGQSNFRAVYLVLNILLLIALSTSSVGFLPKILLGIMLAVSVFLCLRSVSPYSPLYPKKISDASQYNQNEELSILIHNVYQYNDRYEDLLEMVLQQDADIVLLLETNSEWDTHFSRLSAPYKHVVKKVQENTYGIIMMSKIGLQDGRVNQLVYDDIPSVEALLIKNKRKIRIIGLHPEPPIPGEVMTSIPKEKEMLAAANKIEDQHDDELTVVIGDLNDVAWSRIATKFKRLTGLVDPRVGRGFYSTFPTYSPIKMPLDHVFCSPSFQLIEFDTLKSIGSDHRPVLVRLKIPTVKGK